MPRGRAHLASHAAATHPRITSSQFIAPTVTQALKACTFTQERNS